MKRCTRASLRDASYQRGFTIVELLIVIVIIGILAALILVVYNGAQARARNTQTVTAVEVYKKALLSYAIEHGDYPPVTGVNCLGAGYPDLGSGSPARDCQGGTSSSLYTTNPDLDSAIKPYLNNTLPKPSMSQIHAGGNEVIKIGAKYLDQNLYQLNGETHPWWLEYVLEGKPNKCPVGPVYEAQGEHWYNFDTPANLTEEYDNGVVCNTPLPDPSTL